METRPCLQMFACSEAVKLSKQFSTFPLYINNLQFILRFLILTPTPKQK